MQLRLEALGAHLEKTLAPVYVISSDEALLVMEAADAIRRAARRQGVSERSVMHVERAFKWGELLAENQSLSLFGERKLVEIRMPGGKPGKEGAQALEQYVRTHAPDNVSLILLPKLDWSTQKAAWVAYLQQSAVYIEIAPIERARLPAWLEQRLAMQQQSAPREALDFIADRVEGNLLAAHQEIQKLGLLHPAGPLSMQAVQDAVLNVARYDVFKLSEAMLTGDVPRLVRMLNGLKGEGEAPPLVLWAIAEEIRTLYKLKLGQQEGRPLAALCKELRVWGPRERWVGMALARLNVGHLKEALHYAALADALIKGLRSTVFPGDPWDALLSLAMAVARPALLPFARSADTGLA